MNASPEPHELFGYRYILSTTTLWSAVNPIVLEIKIPQIISNACSRQHVQTLGQHDMSPFLSYRDVF